MRNLILVLCILTSHTLFSQTSNSWSDIQRAQFDRGSFRMAEPINSRAVQIDLSTISNQLQAAVLNVGSAVEIPMPDGTSQRFQIYESGVMHPDLAAKYPDIRAFKGKGVDDRNASISITINARGFHSMVLTADQTAFIYPFSDASSRNHISFYGEDDPSGRFFCGTEDLAVPDVSGRQGVNRALSSGTQLRNYRIAPSATGQFTQEHGGTVNSALADIVTKLNENNLVFERDVAITFTMIPNSDTLIFLDENTDPFAPGSQLQLTRNHEILDSLVGNSAYDVGYQFVSGGGAGGASGGRICSQVTKVELEEGIIYVLSLMNWVTTSTADIPGTLLFAI